MLCPNHFSAQADSESISRPSILSSNVDHNSPVSFSRNPWCEIMVHPHRHPHPGTQQACPLATAHPQGPVGAPTWAALPTPWWANYTIVRFIWSQKSTTIFCKSGSTSFHPGQRKSMLFPGSLSRPFLLCSTCLTGATICSKKRKARDQCKTTHTGDGSEKVYPQNNFKEN